jgi:MFS family permease
VGEAPVAAPPLRPSRALAAALSSGFALWWLLGGFRFAFVPLYAQERLGLDTTAIGLGVTASALANLALLYPAGLAADRIGRRAVGVPAFVALAATAGALLLADGLVGYVAANALFGAAYAAASVVPGTLLADATPPGRSGIAAGVGSLANDLGNVLGPVAVGAVLDTAGYPVALALAAGPALLAAGAIAASRRPA